MSNFTVLGQPELIHKHGEDHPQTRAALLDDLRNASTLRQEYSAKTIRVNGDREPRKSDNRDSRNAASKSW
jgi:hypothetical protein